MNELMESSGSVACADGMQEDPGSSSTVSVMSQLNVVPRSTGNTNGETEN